MRKCLLTMKNTLQNLSKWKVRLLSFTTSTFAIATLTGMGAAHAADACKDITIPSKHFIYVADAKFQKLHGSKIPLSGITFPMEDSTNAEIRGRYYVVSSKDLTPDSLFGGKDMVAYLEPKTHPCS